MDQYFRYRDSTGFVAKSKSAVYEMPENRNLMVAAELESGYGKAKKIDTNY